MKLLPFLAIGALISAGCASAPVAPDPQAVSALAPSGKLRVGVKISFTPGGGTTSNTWRSVLLTSARGKS